MNTTAGLAVTQCSIYFYSRSPKDNHGLRLAQRQNVANSVRQLASATEISSSDSNPPKTTASFDGFKLPGQSVSSVSLKVNITFTFLLNSFIQNKKHFKKNIPPSKKKRKKKEKKRCHWHTNRHGMWLALINPVSCSAGKNAWRSVAASAIKYVM